jgi:hypothetical protein
MGIFQQRPEEPTEWAGLPADPWEPTVRGDMLPPLVAGDPALGAAVTSIAVPLSPVVEFDADADGS